MCLEVVKGKFNVFGQMEIWLPQGQKIEDRTKGSQENLQEFSSQCRVQVQQFFKHAEASVSNVPSPRFFSRLLRWGRYEDDLLHLIDKGIRECEDKVGSRSQCDNFSPVPFQSLAFWCFAAALQPVKPGCTGEAEVQWYLIFGSERCWNEHNEHWFLQQNICC